MFWDVEIFLLPFFAQTRPTWHEICSSTDTPHHEYPRRLEEAVSRLLPDCGPEECGCIEDVLLCRGAPGAVQARRGGGDRMTGRAEAVLIGAAP